MADPAAVLAAALILLLQTMAPDGAVLILEWFVPPGWQSPTRSMPKR